MRKKRLGITLLSWQRYDQKPMPKPILFAYKIPDFVFMNYSCLQMNIVAHWNIGKLHNLHVNIRESQESPRPDTNRMSVKRGMETESLWPWIGCGDFISAIEICPVINTMRNLDVALKSLKAMIMEASLRADTPIMCVGVFLTGYGKSTS